MELARVRLGQLVSPSLVGQRVKHDGRAVSGDLLDGHQRALQLARVVPIDRHHVRLLGIALEGHRHPQGVGESGAGVAGRQRVVGALRRLREPGEPARRPDGREPISPAGDQLVRVALVRGVPDEPVPRAVESPVERERQLDDTEVRSEMPAPLRDGLDDRAAALSGELGQLVVGELLQLSRVVDPVEHSHHPSGRVPGSAATSFSTRWGRPAAQERSRAPMARTRGIARGRNRAWRRTRPRLSPRSGSQHRSRNSGNSSSALSNTLRTTTYGIRRSPATRAHAADSMSTTTAPSAESERHRSALLRRFHTSRSTVTTTARRGTGSRPSARATHASSGAPTAAPPRLTSRPTTISPTPSPGERPPATPAVTRRVTGNAASSARAPCSARNPPTPVWIIATRRSARRPISTGEPAARSQARSDARATSGSSSS